MEVHILCWCGCPSQGDRTGSSGQPGGLSSSPKRHWKMVLAAGFKMN